MLNLFLAPHNDDETLFGAFTLMREHPLVVIVTDSWIQYNRGENVRADERWEETKRAMEILGCSVIRLGIRDDVIDEWTVEGKLRNFAGFEVIYAPAIIGGNSHHDLVGKVAKNIFGDKVKFYSTYTKENLWVPGIHEVTPTPEEVKLKNKAMECYQSQLTLPTTKPHFDAVRGQKEGFA